MFELLTDHFDSEKKENVSFAYLFSASKASGPV